MPSKTTPPPTTARLKRLARLIDRALERMLRPADGAPRRLHEAMAYCVASGGKRFRPLLCLGACEAVGGIRHDALTVACAIELIHTYSLVHDDLPAMDDADVRRGKPSCHRRFGEGAAILVGDALLTRAFELLGANGTPNVLEILRTLGRASGTAGLIGGQMLDLEKAKGKRQKAKLNDKTSVPGEWEEIARRKTAALITASVEAGALAGRASVSSRARLRRFGQALGVAFQLKDDLHDRDGMVRAVGGERVAQRAAELLQRARRTLEPLGERAGLLRELTDWLEHS